MSVYYLCKREIIHLYLYVYKDVIYNAFKIKSLEFPQTKSENLRQMSQSQATIYKKLRKINRTGHVRKPRLGGDHF